MPGGEDPQVRETLTGSGENHSFGGREAPSGPWTATWIAHRPRQMSMTWSTPGWLPLTALSMTPTISPTPTLMAYLWTTLTFNLLIPSSSHSMLASSTSTWKMAGMCIFFPTLTRSVAVATTHFVQCVLTHFSQSQCHKGKQHATSEEEHEWALQDTIQASQQTMGPRLPHTDKDSSDPVDEYEKIIADLRRQTECSKTAAVYSILLVYLHALRPVTQFTPANCSTEALTLVTAFNVPGAALSDDNDDEYSPYAQSLEPEEEFYVPEPGTNTKVSIHYTMLLRIS